MDVSTSSALSSVIADPVLNSRLNVTDGTAHMDGDSANVECNAFEIASGSEMSTDMSAGSADVLDGSADMLAGSGVALDASVHRRHVKSMMIRRLRALK